MPGTALWVDAFVCLLGSLVSLCLPSFVSRCLPAWMIQSGWTGSFVSLCHLSPVVSQPGCLARLSGWTGSFVSLCLPPFVSQPGCLARLGFICLPLSPSICLPAWMPGAARVHLSPLISPVVSQPGCLARLSGWTGSFVSLCLPSFVSRCLPAWMPGTALWVDGFICLPLFPSLDVWHSRSAVSFTSRGSVLLAGSGLPSALALASVIPCLVDVGDRVLCLPFIWTSISLGLVVGLQLREGSVNPPVKQT